MICGDCILWDWTRQHHACYCVIQGTRRHANTHCTCNRKREAALCKQLGITVKELRRIQADKSPAIPPAEPSVTLEVKQND